MPTKLALKVMAGLLAVVVVAAAGFYAWASFTVNRVLSLTIETHVIGLPIPFPLSDGELAAQEVTAEEGERSPHSRRSNGAATWSKRATPASSATGTTSVVASWWTTR